MGYFFEGLTAFARGFEQKPLYLHYFYSFIAFYTMSIAIQTGLRWGFIAAFVDILLFLIPYIFNSTLIYTLWYGFLGMLLWLVLAVFAARDTRQQQDGYANLVELLQTAFFTLAIVIFTSNVFLYVFSNFIDLSYINTLKLSIIENTQALMQNFGAPDEEIEKAITALENQDFSMSFGGTVQNTASNWVVGFVISLLVAAIMQRKKPHQTA